MTDPWVLQTQIWLNTRFFGVPGYNPVVEDGETGWPTMYALTRGLQHLLGLSLSDNFGPGTLGGLAAIGNIGPTSEHDEIQSIYNILVGGMYCKGYNGDNGNLNGVWTSVTTAAGKDLRTDIGLSQGDGSISPKVFKCLLTMDPFVLTNGGNATIRSIQQNMNARYLDRQDFFVIPTDGYNSRNGQTALIYALQYELGLGDGVATGVFGPTTRAQLKLQGLISNGSTDSSKYFVHLFQAGLNFNGFPAVYDGVFGSGTQGIVESFQEFVALPVTGAGDFSTWASLMVSSGDTDRVTTAADTSKTITAARAATLLTNGYTTIGRYLTNAPVSGALDKKIKAGELDTLFANGIAVFPIFQEDGTDASHFSFSKGLMAGARAHDAAAGYGFAPDTVIYFGVDFDAYDYEVRASVVPFFSGVNAALSQRDSRYRVGIYGTRNTCIIVAKSGLAVCSFVSDMSTGYSGNLGFPLPPNWAFDQILEYDIGSGSGALDVDKNVKSGRDMGQISTVTPPVEDVLDVATPAGDLTTMPVAVSDWLHIAMNPFQKEAALRSPTAACNLILGEDELVTALARGYRMRKSLIQTAGMWEAALESLLQDVPADALVRATYAAWLNGVSDPPGALWDCSTGAAQIFAGTAIDAINWGRMRGLTEEPGRDIENHLDMWSVWSRLNESLDFNLSMCALVLLKCAFDASLDVEDALDYSEADVKAILTNYNGEPSYGERNYGLYEVLETYNEPARDGI